MVADVYQAGVTFLVCIPNIYKVNWNLFFVVCFVIIMSVFKHGR